MIRFSRTARLVAAFAVVGCNASSELSTPRRFADLEAVVDQSGPIEVETVVSTSWVASRSGLINLDAPTARAAGLEDGDEPIEVFFHAVRHPVHGTFLIDTGVERALRDAPDDAALHGALASMYHVEKMRLEKPLGDWLAAQHEPLRGVFFTHLHLDHITGAPDLPKSTPIYAGPGEVIRDVSLPALVQDANNRAFDGLPSITEWRFSPDPDGRFASIVDVFGDGSFWALWTPGHTPGSTSYVARTPRGPVLFTGDVCHTRWGWENDVEPGSFIDDRAQAIASLARLRRLSREHPAMDVRLGHQFLHPTAGAR